ncbi:Cdc6/Cdc18 family protein [Halococcus thailandensis]|uniref:AAA ATPase n=1 Tax=Halococcus thailandensis JCM 13552 TaxID=1227457 RepID=M0MTM9_9EURY|nr:Cdc6/Cdc18 family protein [Halococcus thailandensis]EMA48698.1 AAA ATPase [Halococcus thailandensis JCM 13552]
MITDGRVLEDNFVPREIEHRNDQMNALADALHPITEGRSALPTFLLGPSGSRKTCLVRIGLDRLREECPSIAYQFVSCWEDYSRFRVLYQIVRTIDPGTVDRRTATTGTLLDRLKEFDGQVIVTLGEVDQLHDAKVLYDLYTTHGVSVVLIVNDVEDLFSRLDDRIVSRLRGTKRIRLDRYTVDELVSILGERACLGLRPVVVDRDRLAHIADAAAGDARVAINILRCAAEEAERDNADEISSAMIADAVDAARDDVQRKQVDEFSPHQRTVYEIVRERGSVSGGDLQEAYRDRVDVYVFSPSRSATSSISFLDRQTWHPFGFERPTRTHVILTPY